MLQRPSLQKVGFVALAVLPVLLMTGCPDLSQVEQLAKTADSAKGNITPIAADFKGSCDRQNLLVQPAPRGSDTKPTVPCLNGEDLQKVGDNLLKEQSLLLEYFDTLGRLAGTDASGFEKVAPNLNTSFQTAGLNSSQQEMAKAAGTLAKNITKMATAGYREKKITEILVNANGAVQTLTKGLADMVDGPNGSYRSLLANESQLLDPYYEVPLRQDPSSLPALVVQAQYQSALNQLHEREEAADGYRKLMLSLGQAHAKLVEDAQRMGFDKNGVKAIATDLAQPISEMTDAINTLQKDAR